MQILNRDGTLISNAQSAHDHVDAGRCNQWFVCYEALTVDLLARLRTFTDDMLQLARPPRSHRIVSDHQLAACCS